MLSLRLVSRLARLLAQQLADLPEPRPPRARVRHRCIRLAAVRTLVVRVPSRPGPRRAGVGKKVEPHPGQRLAQPAHGLGADRLFVEQFLFADCRQVVDAEDAEVAQRFAGPRAHGNLVDRRFGAQLRRHVEALGTPGAPVEGAELEGRAGGDQVVAQRIRMLALGLVDGGPQGAETGEQLRIGQLGEVINGSDRARHKGSRYRYRCRSRRTAVACRINGRCPSIGTPPALVHARNG